MANQTSTPTAPRGFRHVAHCSPRHCYARWVIGPLGCPTLAGPYTSGRPDRAYWFIEPAPDPIAQPDKKACVEPEDHFRDATKKVGEVDHE